MWHLEINYSYYLPNLSFRKWQIFQCGNSIQTSLVKFYQLLRSQRNTFIKSKTLLTCCLTSRLNAIIFCSYIQLVYTMFSLWEVTVSKIFCWYVIKGFYCDCKIVWWIKNILITIINCKGGFPYSWN